MLEYGTLTTGKNSLASEGVERYQELLEKLAKNVAFQSREESRTDAGHVWFIRGYNQSSR